MKPALPHQAQATLASASQTFRALLAPAMVTLPEQVSVRLVQQAEQTRDFTLYEAALHAEREISRNRVALQAGFSRHLATLLERSIDTSYSAYRPSIHDVPAHTALRLVDTVEVEDSVLLMQVAAEYRRAAGTALQELDVRIANLFGQVEVRERENPFRPYLIAKSVALAVADTPVPRARVLAVTQHLAMALAEQAGEIYTQVNALLRSAGVSADLPVGAAPAPVSPPSPTSAGAPAGHAAPAGMAGSAPASSSFAPVPAGPLENFLPGGSAGASPVGARMSGALGVARQRLQERLAQWAAARLPQPAAAEAAPAGRAQFMSTSASEAEGAVADANAGSRAQASALAAASQALPMLRQFLADAARARAGGQAHGAQASPSPYASHAGSTPQPSMPGTAGASLVGHAAASGQANTATAGEAPRSHPAGSSGRQMTDAAPASPLRNFLASHEGGGGSDPRLQHEPFPNLIFENREALEQRSNEPEELITIDVVGMLFDYLLLDQSVPSQIRAQIGRLQYYLLQVALAEPALMTESGHPARQLVNRIGTASLGAEDKPEAMTRVTDHVRELVDTLLSDSRYRPEVLDDQLARFEQFMRQIVLTQHVDTQRGTQQVIEALETAGRRAVQRDALAAALAPVLVSLEVEEYVREFIVAHWVDAIAGATTPQEAVRRREMVPMLAWSVLPKSSRATRQQLLSALGALVRELRAGMQQIGVGKDEADQFFKRLLRTHRTLVGQTEEDAQAPRLNAVRAAFDKALRVQLTDAMLPADAGPGSQSAKTAPAQPAPAVDYLAALSSSGAPVMQALDAGKPLPDDVPSTPAAISASGEASPAVTMLDGGILDDAELVRNRLFTGAEVEIDLDGTVQRGMLVWRDSSVKNMLLSFSNGRRPVAVSVRLFRVLLGKGRARFLEAEPLFDRAVVAVLELAQV